MAKGRPREFVAEDALEEALKVFWRTGYEGASMSELTAAMGVNRPSMYATFGNKEQLYYKVLDRYTEGPASYLVKSLNEPTALAVVERLLYGCADSVTDDDYPHGCLGVNGALACSKEAEPVKDELTARRKTNEVLLRQRLEQAKAENDWPWDSAPADFARYILTLTQGLAVQAVDGASREELYAVVHTVLSPWKP